MILINNDNQTIQIFDSHNIITDLQCCSDLNTKLWTLHLINCNISYSNTIEVFFHKIILEQCAVIHNILGMITTDNLCLTGCHIWTDFYLTNIKNIIIHHCEFHHGDIKVIGKCYSLIMENNTNISGLDLSHSTLINLYIIPHHQELLPSSVRYYETDRTDWSVFNFNLYPNLEYIKGNITTINNTFRTSIYMELNQAINVAQYLNDHPDIVINNNFTSCASSIYNCGKYQVCCDGHIRIKTDYDICEAIDKMVI